MTEAEEFPGTSVQQMCDLVSGLAKALVDDRDRVRVESQGTAAETVLRLFVSPADLGRVTGKQGRTARSLRTILSVAGSKLQHRFNLEVQADE